MKAIEEADAAGPGAGELLMTRSQVCELLVRRLEARLADRDEEYLTGVFEALFSQSRLARRARDRYLVRLDAADLRKVKEPK